MSRLTQWIRARLPGERMRKSDVLAGLSGAIGSVPDGMASGLLAGVNPVHGLYASMAGRVFGGLTTSTKLMVVTTTSASALAAGSALATVPVDDRSAAMVLLTLVAGAVMIVAAALELGRYTRFVSHSVMTGFLSGVAANIAFGQLAGFTGASADGDVAVTKAADVVLHPGRIDLASLLIGTVTVLLVVGLSRTRFGMLGSLAALIVSTAMLPLFGLDSVAQVSDVGDIPQGIPLPALPELSMLTPSLISGAAAVAVIVLVQGVGVAEAAPNRDGTRSEINRDFTGQGVGNVASGFFGGMPVGGSVGQTALTTVAGARTRWGPMWSGLWMVVILVAFAGLVGHVPMPTLSAVLIVAAIGSVDPARIVAIWRSGSTSRIALVATFVSTLLLPVTAAVAVGVTLSLLLQLNQEAVDLKVVQLRAENGRLIEVPAPTALRSREIVILDVYGSLFYAGARTLQVRLPDPGDAESPMVVLRMRGRTTLGATFFVVVSDYARRLDAVGGHLYLSGIDAQVLAYWNQDRLHRQGIALDLYPATATLGESTLAAYAEARVRLRDQPAS
ncbi:SulP family inorganic anion transporter [Nocardia sp. NPDC059180]|uniref:SulP family inorganic anion transporter n=1 Tax=Nocardia sp. NPDC059180 TaxID=3346761 RepID=UPI00367B5C0B